MMRMRKTIAAVLGAAAALLTGVAPAADTTFKVSFPKAASAAALDGRLILVVSHKATPEPRLQVDLEGPLRSPFFFGQTVEAMAPGSAVTLSLQAIGWP